MIIALFSLFATLFASTTGAQTRGKSAVVDVKDRMVEHRAIEATVWGMPIVNFHDMRDGLNKDAGVGYNDVACNSKVRT